MEWTREHLLATLNLYTKLPFGKMHQSNSLIKAAARGMGRTSGSVAMKLTNFASLDPVLQARGIRGLPGVSKQDRAIWNEFHSKLADLAPEGEFLLASFLAQEIPKTEEEVTKHLVQSVPQGPTERVAATKLRRGQKYFRDAVMAAYDEKCCLTGIPIAELLRASHIMPWSKFPEHRLEVGNGLCLSALHDAAFDAGLITFDDEFRLLLSHKLQEALPLPALQENFLAIAGKQLSFPKKNALPRAEFVRYHRSNVFTK